MEVTDPLFAKLAVVNPELMKTVPAKFIAYQGFDALFHSLNGYIANTCNLMSDLVERTAIENIGKYLVRTVKDGNDMEVREGVAFANILSGYSMVAGTGHYPLEYPAGNYRHSEVCAKRAYGAEL